MTSLRQTNSWHWLFVSAAISTMIGAYLFHNTWKRESEKNSPSIQGMKDHADQLRLLEESDALLLEHQISEIQNRIHAYNEAVKAQAGQPIPGSEQEALVVSNEITRALISHQLRIVEQEQTQEADASKKEELPPLPPDAPLEMRRAAAARAASKAQEIKEEDTSLPYNTREIRYVLEGEFKHMFMFLVRQSHLKPPYHFKDIKITPSPHQAGMRMEFTVQIHYT